MKRAKLVTGALGVVAAFVSLGMAGGDERQRAFSFGWNLKPLSDTEKWIRVYGEGDGGFLSTFSVRGTSFLITGIKSVRASGGPAPTCALSGSPATLRCDGPIAGGTSVFVRFGVSGSGGNYEFGYQVGTSPLFFEAGTQGPPFAPMNASLVQLGEEKGRATFMRPDSAKDLEVVPFGFRITKVTKITVAGKSVSVSACKPFGAGIDCEVDVPGGRPASIDFETAAASRRSLAGRNDARNRAAELLVHDPTSDKYAEEEPTADVAVTSVGAGRGGRITSKSGLNLTIETTVKNNGPNTAFTVDVKIPITINWSSTGKNRLSSSFNDLHAFVKNAPPGCGTYGVKTSAGWITGLDCFYKALAPKEQKELKFKLVLSAPSPKAKFKERSDWDHLRRASSLSYYATAKSSSPSDPEPDNNRLPTGNRSETVKLG